MKKKTKIWIICSSIFAAVAVPCALLLNKDNKIVLDSKILYIESEYDDIGDGRDESNFSSRC